MTEKLWSHQERAIERGLERGSVACFVAPGGGKTRIALELARRWGRWPCLVLAPASAAQVWERQSRLWIPEIRTRVLMRGSTERRKPSLEVARGIVVVNYEAFWGLRREIRARKWGTVILDEADRIANPAARITRALDTSDSVREAEHRVALTPWPSRKRLENVFSVLRFVDESALGRRFGDFRMAYFSMDPSGFGWNPQPGAERRIAEKIAGMSVVVRDEDLKGTLGLPDHVEEVLEAPLDGKLLELYREAHRDWTLNGEDIEGGGVRALRLVQIPSGVVADEFLPGPKTRLLVDWLRGIDERERVVVFAWFRSEIRGVAEAVRETGRKSWSLMGGDDVGQVLDDWKREPGGVLVVQHNLAVSWSATESRYAIFHSQPPSAHIRHQCLRRLVRAGQERSVLVLDLVAAKTLDAERLAALKEEKDWIDLLRDLVRSRSESRSPRCIEVQD